MIENVKWQMMDNLRCKIEMDDIRWNIDNGNSTGQSTSA
jgi:hypothetical protein